MNRTTSAHHPPAPREWPRHEMSAALAGLVTGSGMWQEDAFAGVARTAAFLDGTWTPGPGADGPRPAGDGSWTRFIGRTDAVALRAAAPSTRPRHREVLLDFLEMWAATPFADPDRHFRVGSLQGTDRPFGVRDERGAATSVYWPVDGRQRFLEARTADDPGPALPGSVIHSTRTRRGRYTRERLLALVAAVRERGPMPWDPAAVTGLARATGLSRAMAALLLAGAPVPFRFDAAEREVLGLGAAEADDGLQEVRGLTEADLIALLADVLPDDPADLWRPAGPRDVAARLARSWSDRHGAWPQASETAWQAALPLDRRIPAADLCRLLLDPARLPPAGGIGVNPRWLEPEHRRLPTIWDVRNWGDAELLLDTLLTAVPWAYAELPAGDAVRGGAPELVRFLRGALSRADSPGRLLREGLAQGTRHAEERQWLTGGACDRMMARITSGALPEGAYETDPRASAPEVVSRAAGHLGVSGDAAALYLQLLTLPSPTDRHVRRWNGWTTRQHRDAAAELAGRGLVVRDRRARAGRDVFLPGAWMPSGRPRRGLKPPPPLEGWKVPLLGALLGHDGKVTDLPPFPDTLPALFARAWRLVRDGDGPEPAP
ncbi:hypothetical protein [Streptomyces abyssomicinicus]|uniref:hypothetical protein n=1 Tax=Streptomyces abyssomicinicus TaxID=574929 RepID=UPI0012507783|nr:hypothetical protein [Streptomyces abyssomicinicus]